MDDSVLIASLVLIFGFTALMSWQESSGRHGRLVRRIVRRARRMGHKWKTEHEGLLALHAPRSVDPPDERESQWESDDAFEPLSAERVADRLTDADEGGVDPDEILLPGARRTNRRRSKA
jgi:hypothetical protein